MYNWKNLPLTGLKTSNIFLCIIVTTCFHRFKNPLQVHLFLASGKIRSRLAPIVPATAHQRQNQSLDSMSWFPNPAFVFPQFLWLEIHKMDDNEETVIQYLSDLVIRIVSKFALSYQFLKSIGFKKIYWFFILFVNKVNILLPSITIYAN